MTKNRKITTSIKRIKNHLQSEKLSLPKGMDHFQLLRLVKRIGKKIGLNDSLIRQYELMISYTSPIDWQSGNLCICWLSVERMADELGKSIRQVQYNSDALVELGLVSMRLSGNYRRGGQRDAHGKIIWASGVDMKPVLEQIDALSDLALQMDEQERKRSLLNKEISSLRRTIRSMFDQYDALNKIALNALETVCIRPRLSWSLDRLTELWENLKEIWEEVTQILSPEEADSDENDGVNCIQGCNVLQTLYKTTIQDTDCYKETSGNNAPLSQDEARGEASPHAIYFPPDHRESERRQNSGMPLSIAQLTSKYVEEREMQTNDDYGQYQRNAWKNTASLAVQMGIHKTAVAEAVDVFGYKKASELIHQIHQRMQSKTKPIKCAGGYLRYFVKNPRNA